MTRRWNRSLPSDYNSISQKNANHPNRLSTSFTRQIYKLTLLSLINNINYIYKKKRGDRLLSFPPFIYIKKHMSTSSQINIIDMFIKNKSMDMCNNTQITLYGRNMAVTGYKYQNIYYIYIIEGWLGFLWFYNLNLSQLKSQWSLQLTSQCLHIRPNFNW